MENRVIRFSPPDISELEIAEAAEALRSGWITTGPGRSCWRENWPLILKQGEMILRQEKHMTAAWYA